MISGAFVFIQSDQPTTCPHCGSRSVMISNLSHTKSQTEIHQCPNSKCAFVFAMAWDEDFTYDGNGNSLFNKTQNKMQNIKFNYLYRDAGNNKVHGCVVFTNPENLKIDFVKNELRKKLFDQEFFDPSLAKIPRLVFEDFAYDPELDHAFNEFSGLEFCNEDPTDERSLQQFLNEKFHDFGF